MLFCPNCDNILDISKNQPKQKQSSLKIDEDTPISVSDSEADSDTSDVDEKVDERADEKEVDVDVDKISEIIVRLSRDEKIAESELSDYRMEQFTKHKTYQKLEKKIKAAVQVKLLSFFEKIEDSTSAFYVCKNCMYSKTIDEGTLISSKTGLGGNNSYINPDKLKNRIHSKILPYTKNFICIKKDCESHTNPKKKEAVFFRVGDSLQVWYTCRSCESYWKGE